MRKLINIFSQKWFSHWLFIIFFFLHGFSIYLHWLTNWTTAKYFLFSLIAIFIVQLLTNSFLKSLVKTSIALCAIIWSVLYFNFLHTTLNQLLWFQIPSYILAPLTLLCWLILLFILRRSNEEKLKLLGIFLNLIFALFILVDIAKTSYKEITSKKEITFIQDNCNINIKQDLATLPDIYFLVFDEQMSSQGLKHHFNFDNSALDTFLIHKGFHISHYSKSNYSQTAFSVGSTLQMQYFDNLTKLTFPDDNPLGIAAMQQNRLFQLLENRGYEISNYSMFDIGKYHTKQFAFFDGSVFSFYFRETLIKHLYVLWQQLNPNKHPEHIDNMLNNAISRKDKNNKPRFVYLHLLLPHYPFVFNADGSVRNANEYNRQRDTNHITHYLNQVTFTRSVIQEAVEKILADSNAKIIVLEGDHGFRAPEFLRGEWYKKYEHEEGAYKNLNAYYFFDKNYSKLYDSISPVNSFRLIGNQYLRTDCDLLEDKSVF